MKSPLIVLASVLLLFFMQTVPQTKSQIPQKGFRLGFVNKGFEVDGDSIWLANTKKKDRVDRKAIAILGYGNSGVINIDGRNIKLKLANGDLPDQNFKVGRGGYQVWKGNKTAVRLDYIFTWLCPQKQENCSVYYYKGVLDVNYKGKRRKVNILGFGGS
jgi:hypothetical protein